MYQHKLVLFFIITLFLFSINIVGAMISPIGENYDYVPLNQTINQKHGDADYKLDTELQILLQEKVGGMTILSTEPKDGLIPILIESESELTGSEAEKIEELGGQFDYINRNMVKFGNIYKLITPISKIKEISNLSFIKRLEYAVKEYVPLLDITAPRIGASSIWHLNDVNNIPVRGKGVTTAIIDTGIDFSHEFFHYLNGTSKIKKIYSPLEGKICTRENLTSCDLKDTNGHGTMMAGILAGGRVDSTNLVGIAPDTDLLVIKNYDTATSIMWAISEGAKVISMAVAFIGHEFLDGSSLTEQIIDQASRQNVTIVVSAGNFANAGWHSSPIAYNGNFTNFMFRLDDTSIQHLMFTFLWRNPNSKIGLWMMSPNDNQPIFLGRLDMTDTYCNINSTIGINYCFSTSVSSRNTAQLALDVYNYGRSSLPTGVWNFWLDAINLPIPENSRRVEAYVFPFNVKELVFSGARFLDFVNSEYTVTAPADADSAITVGAVAAPRPWNPLRPGEVSIFSGRGPRIDGVIKPEIMAPGEQINTSLSKDGLNNPLQLQNQYGLASGTSPSAPIVAGSIALLLQKDPYLTTSQIRNILFNTTSSVTSCSNVYDCGFGEIRINNSYERITNLYWHDSFPEAVNSGIFYVQSKLKNANSMASYNLLNEVSILNDTGIKFAEGETGYDFLNMYSAGSDSIFYYKLNATKSGKYFVRFSTRTENMGNPFIIINFTVLLTTTTITSSSSTSTTTTICQEVKECSRITIHGVCLAWRTIYKCQTTSTTITTTSTTIGPSSSTTTTTSQTTSVCQTRCKIRIAGICRSWYDPCQTTTTISTTTTAISSTSSTTTGPTTSTTISGCTGKSYVNCRLFPNCQWVGDTRLGHCTTKQTTFLSTFFSQFP